MLGRGGMAVVWEARDPDLNRRVAIKILHPHVASDRELQRFQREATIAARLRHPNIVAIHDVGCSPEGSYFIAMDLVDGPTFAEAMHRLPRAEALRVIESIARALAYAHAQGVVHRDVKPHNILVEKGHAWLTDFGLARAEHSEALTRTGAVLGTPQYMAPEQVRGDVKRLGPATDVWALGAILYEVLAGTAPFAGETAAELYEAVLAFDPAPPSASRPGVAADFDTICLKALDRDPRRRYANAGAFADDLARAIAGEPIRARPPSTWTRVRRRLVRHPAMLAAGGALVAALAVGGTALAVQHVRASRAQQESQRRLAAEEALRLRREAALQRLATLGAAILERKSELRTRKLAPDRARAELEEAVAAVDAHVRDWPGDPQGYYVRARGRWYLGDVDAAVADIRAALDRHAGFRPGWSLLGLLLCESAQAQLYRAEGRLRSPRVAEELRRAVEALDRGWPAGREKEEAARWGLAWSREDQVIGNVARALRLMLEEKVDAGVEAMRRAFDEFPAEEYARLIGNALQTPRDKLEWFDKAIALAPGFAPAYVDRGTLRHDLGDRAAVDDLSRALEINPRHWVALNNRGTARQHAGDVQGAIDDFTRLIESPCDARLKAEAHNARGAGRAALGDEAGALADYERAVALDPALPDPWYNRGNQALRKRDFERAAECYSKAIEVGPDAPRAWLAYMNRGNVRAQLGDTAGALADYDAAVVREQRHPLPWFNRGTSRMKAGDWKGAVADLEKALALAPPDWPLREDAGHHLAKARAKRGE